MPELFQMVSGSIKGAANISRNTRSAVVSAINRAETEIWLEQQRTIPALTGRFARTIRKDFDRQLINLIGPDRILTLRFRRQRIIAEVDYSKFHIIPGAAFIFYKNPTRQGSKPVHSIVWNARLAALFLFLLPIERRRRGLR